MEKTYFWICYICGANNAPKGTCQCGNTHYSPGDMFPIFKVSNPEERAAKIAIINSKYGVLGTGGHL